MPGMMHAHPVNIFHHLLIIMQINNTIAVLGGTGKSGQYLIRQLLGRGFSVKMLLRDPLKLQIKSPFIEIVPGNARDPKAIHSLISGSQAVISTLGQPVGEPSIFSDATRNVLRAMNDFQIKRYILTTGINVDTPQDRKSGYTASATEWMKANYPKTTADKQAEWELLEASTLEWTLVRLPLIELTNDSPELKKSLFDCPGEKISATSLAVFLVDQLSDKTYLMKSPFIATVQ